MENEKVTKLFAFKLAQKQTAEAKPAMQWKVREGVAIAGCSDPSGEGHYRLDHEWYGHHDQGFWC